MGIASVRSAWGLRGNPAPIRSGKLESIDSAIQTGKGDGMVLLDDELRRLLELGRISVQTARRFAKEPESIRAAGSSWQHSRRIKFDGKAPMPVRRRVYRH